MEHYFPTGQRCLPNDKSLSAERHSGKVIAIWTCLRAFVGNSGIFCQGVFHLSPTLPKHRGVIIYSGDANPANLSDLLSEQCGASVAHPVCCLSFRSQRTKDGRQLQARHCATKTHLLWHLLGTSLVRDCAVPDVLKSVRQDVHSMGAETALFESWLKYRFAREALCDFSQGQASSL